MPQFIETQFPIARLSAEAFRERKAVSGQTLTGLGKWWGRKPLILCRAAILGMLMPASDNPLRDREIFLKILTMDDDGAWLRCTGEIPVSEWRRFAPSEIQQAHFTSRGFRQGISEEQKAAICDEIWRLLNDEQKLQLDSARRRPIPDRVAFDALPYTERIKNCHRPEQIEGPSPLTWRDINGHLGTTAQCLHELISQLGEHVFGHTPRVGDAFCGGGSVPFEAARIGCEAFGSDLNPVAGLLTWAGLNLLGGDQAVQDEVAVAQRLAFNQADMQITNWGIEHNEQNERAEAFLYCVEVKPEGCDYFIPLAPSWVVDEYCKVIVRWLRMPGSDRLQPAVTVVSRDEVDEYKQSGSTIVDGRVVDPFDVNRSWALESLRGPNGLRPWTNDDLVPRSGDVFQERLYCIRWINAEGHRRYAAPEAADLIREARVLELLRQRFFDWQREGYIPSRPIPTGGEKTDEPIRTRGWTHWHHLFTPRQLLVQGLLASQSFQTNKQFLLAAAMLNIGRIADRNSRLCRWMSSPTQIAGGKDTFYNLALNTLFSYSTRPIRQLESAQVVLNRQPPFPVPGSVHPSDARDLNCYCDLWITDPPYADAVNYHEVGEFFLSWYEKQLVRAFPGWKPDARSELAVRGDGYSFRNSMVEVYRNLTQHMPDNGMQMVMFTHQNPAVWADLGMILWAAGLRATAAWTISTETDAVGIKKGNYVQGTVCLVLRKRLSAEPGFLDEIYPMVEDEVRRQIDSMQALDEGSEPNFNDADYQLAAYAAALKVLTQYSQIDGRDVEHEVFAVRERHETSQFQQVIERALQIACDYLIPRGLDQVWRELSLDERYYLRALDIESRGERRQGMYEELARGFGVTDIRPLLKSDKANGARVHTATGFARTLLTAPSTPSALTDQLSPTPKPTARGKGRGRGTGTDHAFARSPLRHLLFAIKETTAADHDPEQGRQYLRDTFGGTYWATREKFIALLDWLSQLSSTPDMAEWSRDSDSARILAGRLRNDQG